MSACYRSLMLKNTLQSSFIRCKSFISKSGGLRTCIFLINWFRKSMRDIGVLKVSYSVKQCLITTIRNIIDWKFSNTISMEANTKYNVSNYLYSFSPSCIYFEFSSAPCGISYLFDGRVY